MKREIEKLKDQHERQLNGVRKGVAQRRSVDISSVYIDGAGNVTYDP